MCSGVNSVVPGERRHFKSRGVEMTSGVNQFSPQPKVWSVNP